MGSTYVYKCTACKYEAEISGGKDSGFLISTQTKMCPNCRQLVDVVTGTTRDPVMAKELKLNPAKSKSDCPQCGNFKLLAWKGRACPKCGGKMKQDGDGPVCMWD